MRAIVLGFLIAAPFAAAAQTGPSETFPSSGPQLWPSKPSQSIDAAPALGSSSPRSFGAGAADLARPGGAASFGGQAPGESAAPAFGAYDLARLRGTAPPAVLEAGARAQRG